MEIKYIQKIILTQRRGGEGGKEVITSPLLIDWTSLHLWYKDYRQKKKKFIYNFFISPLPKKMSCIAYL